MATVNRAGRRRSTIKRGTRLAIALTAIGGFLLSSGLVLLTQGGAAAASGHIPVGLCHATSSDSNPFTYQVVDASSSGGNGLNGPNGHLAHRNAPNKTWKTAGFFQGVGHRAGDPKRDLISDYTDAAGVFHKLDGTITAASCQGSSTGPVVVTGNIVMGKPTCPDGATSFATTGDHISFVPASGTTSSGTTVTSIGTTEPGYVFAGGAITQTFTDTAPAFDPASCNAGNGLTVVTVDVTFHDPTCQSPAGTWEPVVDPAYPHAVSFSRTSGSTAAGSPIEITATAASGYAFDAKGTTTKTFTYIFGTLPNCGANLVQVTPEVTFTDPTCQSTGSWTPVQPQGHPNSVIYTVTAGSSATGDSIEITAQAAPGYDFDGAGKVSEIFTHAFDAASNCGVVSPPAVVAPAVDFAEPTCSTPGSWSSTALDHVTYSPSPSGTGAAGTTVTVTATSDGTVVFNASGDKTKDFSYTFATPTGCSGGVTSPPQVVRTTAPTFTDATCAAPAATGLTLPGTAGTANGGAVATSVLNGVTYTATGSTDVGHTVVVKAVAGTDQVFAPDTTTTWAHTFAAPTGCSTTLPPTHHGHQGQHGHHSGGGTSGEHTVTQAPQAGHTPSGTVVPTMVDAGQVGVVTAQAPTSVLASLREYGVLLVIAGGLLLLGGGSWLGTGSWLGRSRRGRGALG
ncbi:MAG: hypothetical protein ACTHJH_17715 [Marmoricola sp.]